MGDANKEIAFGAVAGAVVGGALGAGAAHVAGDQDPILWASVGAIALGVTAGTILWKAEKTPGSWANPVLTTETAPDGTPQTIVANPTPPTPLATTVSVLDVIAGLGAAAAAIGIFYDWSSRRPTAASEDE